MSVNKKPDWPRIIRSNVLNLIILYIALALITIVYIFWQKNSLAESRRNANEYHLASNYHFVKAGEEIHQYEMHLASHRGTSNHDSELPVKPILNKEEEFYSTSYHLLQQDILAGINLHRRFSDNKFDALVTKLEQQMSVLDTNTSEHFITGEYSERISRTLVGLRITLRQLEKLHLIEREKGLAELNVLETNQTITLLILLSIVSMAGFLVTKRTFGAIQTISNQQIKSEEQVRLFSLAVNQSPVSVIITDTDANIVYVNRSFETVTGYKAEDVRGKNPGLLLSSKTSPEHYNKIWKTLNHGESIGCELENQKKNGETLWENAHFAPVRDDQGVISHFLIVKEDITLRKRQQEHILQQAHYDALTNLPNRFLVLDRLSKALKDAKRKNNKVALLFLDLDDFKKVNDTLGHDMGDNLLIEAAQRLLAVVRDGDTVGRLGGDEFILLIDDLTDVSEVLPVMDNVVKQFNELFKLDGRELIITGSLGAAVYPDDGSEPSELLRNADAAMYHAKELGRNTYSFFTESMNQKVSRRLALEEQMFSALEQDEFYVLFQPQFEINSGRLIGAEALVRWHNPVLNQVFPDEFIPIAEQIGMIVDIGKYVLKSALEFTAQCQQEAVFNFRMAVNLSPIQLRDQNLVTFIESVLNEYEVSPSSLELEITEGVLMGGHNYVENALSTLNNLGVQIAMDDFGTGYSSLSYLRNYSFNILKIDRSFINDITVDPSDRELVNAIIAMAHGLGLDVIAEGVETEEQLAYLQAQGCQYAQGYYFSKPVPPDEILEMIKVQNLEFNKSMGAQALLGSTAV